MNSDVWSLVVDKTAKYSKVCIIMSVTQEMHCLIVCQISTWMVSCLILDCLPSHLCPDTQLASMAQWDAYSTSLRRYQVWYPHSVMEIDSLPSADLRRAVISFRWKNVHKYWLTTLKTKSALEKCVLVNWPAWHYFNSVDWVIILQSNQPTRLTVLKENTEILSRILIFKDFVSRRILHYRNNYT